LQPSNAPPILEGAEHEGGNAVSDDEWKARLNVEYLAQVAGRIDAERERDSALREVEVLREALERISERQAAPATEPCACWEVADEALAAIASHVEGTK
jgi:hypothetical protein